MYIYLCCFCSPCVTVSLDRELSPSKLEQAMECCSMCTPMASIACLTTISALPITSRHFLYVDVGYMYMYVNINKAHTVLHVKKKKVHC